MSVRHCSICSGELTDIGNHKASLDGKCPGGLNLYQNVIIPQTIPVLTSDIVVDPYQRIIDRLDIMEQSLKDIKKRLL